MSIKKDIKDIKDNKEDFEIIIKPSFWEQTVVYDFNWIYFRRKIISFNHYLNFCIQYPLIIIYLHLKIVYYKYYIWFNGVFNNG